MNHPVVELELFRGGSKDQNVELLFVRQAREYMKQGAVFQELLHGFPVALLRACVLANHQQGERFGIQPKLRLGFALRQRAKGIGRRRGNGVD